MSPLWTLQNTSVKGTGRPRLFCEHLEIPEGITAILGPSGAGKTTMLNLLVAFPRPHRSCIRHFGHDAPHTGLPLFWTPQDTGLWPHLSVRQQLETVFDERLSTSIDAILDAFALSSLAERSIDALSSGERARLGVARAMAACPLVSVFDEPLAHVDRQRRQDQWRHVVRETRHRAASLVYATHVPQMVIGEADHVIYLHNGEVLFAGPVEELYWHPATPRIANALGDTNWMTDADVATWLPGNEGDRNYRPVELKLAAISGTGPLTLEHIRFRDVLCTVELRHVPSGIRREFHLATPRDLPTIGSAVRLTHDAWQNREGAA